jgi:hypothetical protein
LELIVQAVLHSHLSVLIQSRRSLIHQEYLASPSKSTSAGNSLLLSSWNVSSLRANNLLLKRIDLFLESLVCVLGVGIGLFADFVEFLLGNLCYKCLTSMLYLMFYSIVPANRLGSWLSIEKNERYCFKQ